MLCFPILFWGCATHIISTKTVEVSSQPLQSQSMVEIKQIDSVSASNPFLNLQVQRITPVRKTYKTTTRYKREFPTLGWIGVLCVGVAGLGAIKADEDFAGSEDFTGGVALVAAFLSSYLFSKTFSGSEEEEKVLRKSEAIAHEPVSLKIEEISFSQEIETDGDGNISLDLSRLMGVKAKDKPLTIAAHLKKDPSVSEKVYISSDFIAQLFRNKISLSLTEAKEKIRSCEFKKAIQLTNEVLSRDRTNKEANEVLQKAKKMEERFQKAKITLIAKNIDSSLRTEIESQLNIIKKSLGEGFSWDIFPCILTIEGNKVKGWPDIKLTVDYANIRNYKHKEESYGIRYISLENPNKLTKCLIPCCKIVARHLGMRAEFGREPWNFLLREVEYRKKNGDKVRFGYFPLIFGKIGGQRISVKCKYWLQKGTPGYKRFIVLPSTKQANLVWKFFSK